MFFIPLHLFSIIEFIRAKKYAFGFKGDTDRKVAIWLQEKVLL